jgi:hypothetical protein
MNYSLGGFRHEKKDTCLLGADVLLIVGVVSDFSIFSSINPAFYAVPMIACLSFRQCGGC